MKKKFIYPITIFLFAVAIVLIILKFNQREKQVTSYPLKERNATLAKGREYVLTQASADRLKLAIEENPEDKKSLLSLAALYIKEARITGDHPYYDMAALQQVNAVLKMEPKILRLLLIKPLFIYRNIILQKGSKLLKKPGKSILIMLLFMVFW